MDPELEDDLVHRVGYRAYGLLVRLRVRDQERPAKAADFTTPEDRSTSVINALQKLERHGLLSREPTFLQGTGKVVYYRTHVPNDPLQHTE